MVDSTIGGATPALTGANVLAQQQNKGLGDNVAWLAGLKVGQNKKKGDWSIQADYRQVGLGSIDPNLNDSDWAESFLNQQGVKVQSTYNRHRLPERDHLIYYNTWDLKNGLFDGTNGQSIVGLPMSPWRYGRNECRHGQLGRRECDPACRCGFDVEVPKQNLLILNLRRRRDFGLAAAFFLPGPTCPCNIHGDGSLSHDPFPKMHGTCPERSPLFLTLAGLWIFFFVIEWIWPCFFLHDDNATQFLGFYVHDFRVLTQTGRLAEVNFYQYGGEPCTWNRVKRTRALSAGLPGCRFGQMDIG